VDTPGLDIDTISDELSLFFKVFIFTSEEFGETPFLGNNDTLLSREFIFGSSQGFHGTFDVVLGGSDGIEGLADFDTGAFFVGLTESSSHTTLETISTGTGQHLVNTDDVPRVHAASHVESFLTTVFDHVFVGGNTSSFHSAGGNLFFFPRDHVNGPTKIVTVGFFSTNIVGSDFGIRATTAESGFRIRFVLGVAIASSRSSSHLKIL
jgi:hypothetical protein